MDEQSLTALRASYDRVAEEYARRISDELLHKPLDRELLDRFAAELQGRGTICDVGCGPGHVARYLHDRGARVMGIDLSAGMVEQARRRHPRIDFQQGDMRRLSAIADGAWAGIAAFYSIIHVPRQDVATALGELRRTLSPGGLLLLAFHVGDEVVHLDEWWGQPVSADFAFFRSAEMVGYLTAAGFEIVETIERPPYPDVEHQSDRAYILASRPGQQPSEAGDEGPARQEASVSKVTEMHEAVKRGDVARVQSLLAEDRTLANAVSETDARGTYPLHVAAEFGQADAARTLIEGGADISRLDAENAAIPLGWAAFFGRPDVVRVLLEAGSDPSQRNTHGLTPLGCAVGGTQGKWRQFSDATIEDWQRAADIIRTHGGSE